MARDVHALEREKATRDEARAKQAAARQDGPIQKMQKGDLYKKIVEVFFELLPLHLGGGAWLGLDPTCLYEYTRM